MRGVASPGHVSVRWPYSWVLPILLLAIFTTEAASSLVSGSGGAKVGGHLVQPFDHQVADPGDSPEPGASLSVYLLTIGRGDAIWERFGHNAIWVLDRDSGWETAFNWGMFDFRQADFIPRLIRGTMLYWMTARDPSVSLETDRIADRPAWIQELDLTAPQKLELLAFLQENARPENKYYRYDYYRDNCSTRVRDALDRVLGGGLRVRAEADTTAHTYRWHTRRLLRDVPLAYLGIQVVLGPAADEPLTAWDEAFLPLRLMEDVRKLEVPDEAGGTRPLVLQERQILESTRPPEPSEPPAAWIWFLVVGVVWGGGILGLSRRGSRLGFPGRLGLATLAGGWALLASVGGGLLLGAWAFTDHFFWYRNLNLLQMNPLFLPLVVAFGILLFKGSFPRWARDLAAALGVLAGAGLLVGVLPGMGQSNGEVLALVVPLNGAMVLGSLWLFADLGSRPDSPAEG